MLLAHETTGAAFWLTLTVKEHDDEMMALLKAVQVTVLTVFKLNHEPDGGTQLMFLMPAASIAENGNTACAIGVALSGRMLRLGEQTTFGGVLS